MMIDLYYWPTPNGWKISIMLEELGVPYTTHLVNIGAGEQFESDFLKIAPNNRMPAIIDPDGPDGQPVSIFESGAILQYLARKYGRFYGETVREQIEIDQWLMWQMGGVGPMAGQTHYFLHAAPEDIPFAKKRYQDETKRLYGVLDRRLADRDYVAGPYSIADIALWGWVSCFEKQQIDMTAFTQAAAWLERVGARDGVKRGRALYAELRK